MEVHRQMQEVLTSFVMVGAHKEPYENLANSIIVQAVYDYCHAQEALKKDPRNKHALWTLRECEAFFQSRWFGVLTTIRGLGLVELCNKFSAEILKTAHVHPIKEGNHGKKRAG